MIEIMASALSWAVVAAIASGLIIHLIASVGEVLRIQQRGRMNASSAKTVTILMLLERPVSTTELLNLLGASARGRDIVVIKAFNGNDVATQAIRKKVKQRRNTRMYSPRNWQSISDVFARAYQRSHGGKVIVTLDQSMQLPVSSTAALMSRVQVGRVVRLSEKINEPVYGINSLIRIFAVVTRSIMYEIGALFSVYSSFKVGRSTGYAYSKSDFKVSNLSLRCRWCYAPDIAVLRQISESAQPPRPQPYSIIAGALFVVLVGATAFVAASLQTTDLLTAIWLGTVIWLAIAILVNQAMTANTKLTMYLSLPLMPLLLIATMIVNIPQVIARLPR